MSKISEALRRAAQQEARSILDNFSGVMAVVIATTDGFDVASAVTRGIDPVRVAAMASSISAIGSVVSQEAQLGRSKSVTISTEQGFSVLSTVYRPDVELVVNVVAGATAVLAQIAYRSNECVRALEAA